MSGAPSTAAPLRGRVALVTGATGLLGRQHCAALAQAGAHVVVADLDAGSCSRVAEGLAGPAADGAPVAEPLPLSLDVTAAPSLQAARTAVLRRFDRLDVLVNNAAIDDKFESPAAAAELSKFENYPVEAFRRSLEVNVTGVFLASQVLGAVMAERRQGSIINVASTYGLVAPDQSLYRKPDGTQSFFKSAAYPTGKGAVLAFTRFLAAYWGERGVRVNALCPGGVQNGQDDWFQANYSRRTPLGRMAQASDYRGAIVFLASEASSYMTGQALVVDGGFTAW